MSNAMLNAAKVKELINQNGLRQNWVIEQMGLKPTTGNMMLREGLLPKDKEIRNRALQKLARLLGVEVSQILLRLDVRQKQSA